MQEVKYKKDSHMDSYSSPPSSSSTQRRFGMSSFRSFSNIGKKAKEGVVHVEGEGDGKMNLHRTSLSSWHTKKSRSGSSSKPGKASNYFANEPELPSPPVNSQTFAPRLPPLSLPSYSSPSTSSPSSPVARLNGGRLPIANSFSSQDILLPPQPAFLGRRSSSAPNRSGASNCSSMMNGSNSSNVSLMSTTSSMGTEATSVPLSSASNADSLRLQQDKASKDPSAAVSGVRLTMRSLSKRFFSRSERPDNTHAQQPSTFTSPSRPAMARAGQENSLRRDHSRPNHSSSPNQVVQTTPLSTTASSSSCTSTAPSSPETPSVYYSPISTGRMSINSAATVQAKSADAVSPTFSLDSRYQTSEESSDLLRAILSYALADTTELPELPTANIVVQKQRAALTPTITCNIAQDDKKRDISMARSAWSNETADESDESDDDYGEEVEKASGREEHASRSQIADLHKPKSQIKPVARRIGLDTAGKQALYACTIVKFYPKLAVTAHKEIKVPRSINSADSLRGHFSTYSHTRSIRIGLGRSQIIRRLNTESLSLKTEQELDWFVAKYLPLFISPHQLPLHLAQKAVQSSQEALARPPIVQGNENGMALWVSRPSFEQRCECTLASDKNGLPLKDLCLQIGQLFNKSLEGSHTMPLQLSQRCQALATMSSAAAKSFRSGLTQDFKTPASPSDDVKDRTTSSSKASHLLAPPWSSPPSTPRVRPSQSVSRSPSPLRLEVPASSDKLRVMAVAGEDEEDVPLAHLLNRRRSRTVSENGASITTSDSYTYRVKEQQERELVLKKQRELLLLQEQKRHLQKARERRKATDHAAVLSSPTYGAGHALLGSNRQSRAVSEVGSRPISNRYSRSYQSTSQIGPASTSNRTSHHDSPQHDWQVQRPTVYSNPSMPNLATSTSPPSARRERPTRSRVHSQASAPSAWSPSPKKSPPSSSSQRLPANPPMIRATSLQSMPLQYQSMPPPTMIPQHAIPYQQPISPYAMMPMTSPPSFNRQSVVMVPSYYSSPMPYHTPSPPFPLSHSPSQYRVNVDAA